jgi:6-methylsalicylate decarboxylase
MGHDHGIAGGGNILSRRQTLTALAAVGASALLPGGGVWAQAGKAKLIDTHHHYYPPELLASWDEFITRTHDVPQPPMVAHWTPQQTLAEMDKGGTTTAILSLASIPGVWFGADAAGMRRMSRLCNEYSAKMVQDYPGRFGLFASLPMPDVDGALKEIEYALDTLKADGINLSTSFGDRWPADPEFKPVFEELNRRKAIVYFHPYAPNCCGNLATDVPASMLEYPYDTGRTITGLLLSGTLARLRDIRWLFSHGGGVMPMLAGRVEYFANFRKDIHEIAPDGVLAELQRLYYDTANAAWPSAMAGLTKMVPPTQIVFGTDYPYLTTAPQRDALRKDGLSEETIAMIESGNAMKLIPRLTA